METRVKFNSKQIMLSILGIGIGVFMVLLGLLSGGAGHGPFPEVSLGFAFLGFFVSAISFLVLLTVLISGILGKDVFSSNSNKIILDYNWRCPKCDAVVQENIGVCDSCKFSLMD